MLRGRSNAGSGGNVVESGWLALPGLLVTARGIFGGSRCSYRPRVARPANSRAASPLFFTARGRRRLPSLSLAKRGEGVEHRTALPRECLALRRAAPCEGASPSGAPPRLFCPRRRASRRADGEVSLDRPGRLPPSIVPATSSHQRQPVLVPADGWPGPPERGVRTRPRAPPPPRISEASCRDAPRVGWLKRNIILDNGGNKS